MRQISCYLTQAQVRARIKTKTRRLGASWINTKPGDRLRIIEKGQGLQKGERVVPICDVTIKSVKRERLCKISQADVVAEGFPDMTIRQFVEMFCLHMKCHPKIKVTVIEWEYDES